MAFSTYNSFQRNLTSFINSVSSYIFAVDASLVLYYPFSSVNTSNKTPNYASSQAVYNDSTLYGTSKITTIKNTYITSIADLSLNNTAGNTANDYVISSNTIALVPSTGLSISCWFSSNGQLNTNQTLFSLPFENNTNGINLTLSNTNTIYSSYGYRLGIINTLSQTTKQNLLYSSGTALSAGAYGVILLNNLYYDPIITIRRSSDSISANFYSDLSGNLYTGYLSTGTSLTSWLNGATAYVSKWWDQTGNGNHATQTNTTSQPVYNTTGNYIDFGTSTAGGNANAYFDLPPGAHPFYDSEYSYVFKYSATTTNYALFGSGSNTAVDLGNNLVYYPSTYNNYWLGDDVLFNYTYIVNTNTIISLNYSKLPSKTRNLYINGSSLTGSGTTYTTTNYTRNQPPNSLNYIGADIQGRYLNGRLYYAYIVPIAISDADRIILEST